MANSFSSSSARSCSISSFERRLLEPTLSKFAATPLLATEHMLNEVEKLLAGILLTADGLRVVEGFGNFRVHLNVEVVLSNHRRVSFFDSGRDPLLELITDQGVCDVADPLSRQLVQVTFFWEEIGIHRVLLDLAPDLLDCQGLVVRHEDVVNGLADDI